MGAADGNAPARSAVRRTVVDVVRAILVVTALVASVRARFAGGVVAGLVCAAIFALEVFLVVRFPLRPERFEIAMGMLFLGPTSWPHAAPIPATALLSDPLHHVGAGIVAALAAWRAFGRAAELPPDSLPSRALDHAGLRFVAVGVVMGLLSVAGLLARLLGSSD